MNCCDEYGDCRQSDDCPARTGKVLPHQAAHARRVAAAHGVAPIKSSRPKWLDGDFTPVPPEAGNFTINNATEDGQPLSHDETMALVRTLLVWLVIVVCVVVAVSVGVGYGTERFSDVLWADLAQLS
jgi:hypothetical protein